MKFSVLNHSPKASKKCTLRLFQTLTWMRWNARDSETRRKTRKKSKK
jgi:hypothetical protein